MERRKDLVRHYFYMEMQQIEIVSIHACSHNIFISERHLRRVLKDCNLHRRKHLSDFKDVVDFIENEIRGSGKQHGYLWMCHSPIYAF